MPSDLELIMEDCIVPKENLIGKEGKGFGEFFLAIQQGLLNFGDLIGATIKKFDGIILAIPTKIGGALGSIKGFFT